VLCLIGAVSILFVLLSSGPVFVSHSEIGASSSHSPMFNGHSNTVPEFSSQSSSIQSDVEGAFEQKPNIPSGETGLPLALSKVLLVKTATLEIELKEERPSAIFVEQVSKIAESIGGYVASFQTNSESTRNRYGPTQQMLVKVPAQQLDTFLQEVRSSTVTGFGARILAETLTSEDVSDEFFDMESRMQSLEAAHQQYVKLLSQAESVTDILAVQAALQPVVQQLEQWKGKRKQLSSKIQFSTVHIQLRCNEELKSSSSWRDVFSPSQTVAQCLRLLLTLISGCLNFCLAVIIVGMPLVVFLVLAFWLGRILWRTPSVANFVRWSNLPV
jgi:hypothetical protein